MLLKLGNNTLKKLFSALCFITLLFSSFADAEENVSQQMQWHGFFSQGLLDVNGSNFINDDGKVSLELTEIGINTSYQINDDFRFAAQGVYLNGGNRFLSGARIDYLLLDWAAYNTVDWQANILFGRIKNNHWLYSTARDIPFARPSIILPQSVYFDGFRDIAVGSDGIALNISHNNNDYGDFDFHFTYGNSPISTKNKNIILSRYALGEVKQDYSLQTSIYWQPALSQWRLGLAYLDSEFRYDHNEAADAFVDAEFIFTFYLLNFLYEGEQWEFSGEWHQKSLVVDGFYYPDYYQDNVGQSVYLQSRYKVNKQLTLLTRVEHFYSDKNDKTGRKLEEKSFGSIPRYFGFQHDLMFGLSYDLTDSMRLNLEYHLMQGTARLGPVLTPDPVINNHKNWQIFAAQFMYWF